LPAASRQVDLRLGRRLARGRSTGRIRAAESRRTDTIHRLNRAGYRNAVRDLLALDIDVASLLPADDMSYGFDNAGVLKSRRRCWIATWPPRVRSVESPWEARAPDDRGDIQARADLSQDESFDTLPVGTGRHLDPLSVSPRCRIRDQGRAARRRCGSHELGSPRWRRVQLFTLNPRSGFGTGQGYDSKARRMSCAFPSRPVLTW
jgi:hypothetical protein